MSQKHLLALAVTTALFGAGAVQAEPKEEPVPAAASDSLLVIFKPGVDRTERLATINSAGASLRSLDASGRDLRYKHVAGGRLAKVMVPQGADRDAILKKLSQDPAIAVAEPNYTLHINATPDDPRYNDQWGLNNTGQTGGTPDADIDAPEAWDISTGSHDVIVGVIDTGIDYSHPDLAGNVWTNPGEIPGNGIDDDGNGYVDDVHGISSFADSGDPMDDQGHGTHVSGTIGAKTNNATGVAGVNWDVSIAACKFLDSEGYGSTADAIECLDYFTDLKLNHGVNIRATNNSWGGGAYSDALKAAIETAGDAGILFVVAAGNAGSDLDASPGYPASYDSDAVLAVASTDHNDAMSGFSSYGATTVDLGAPGSDILSTYPGGGYATASGTSMATPHVTGVAALVWSVNPDLSIGEMKQLLMDSGDSLPALDGKTLSGKRLNAKNALDAADPTPGFKLGVMPGSGEIVAGESASFEITVGSISDWEGDVTLSLTTDPALEGASLSASTAQPGDVVTLTVDTTAETPWGSYNLTVSGDNGEMQKEVAVSLSILPQGLEDFPFSNANPVAIPDNSPEGIQSTIDVADAGTVFGVDVGVNISHTWVGDLIVTLVSPSGTEKVLASRSGGSADDLVQNWNVASFNGEEMQGTWTLVVSDNANADTGTLNSWDLNITALGGDTGPRAPVAGFSAAVSGLDVVFTDSSTDRDDDITSWAWDFGDGTSSVEASPSHSYAAAGTYTVTLTVTDATGLTGSSSQSVTVSDSTIELSLKRAYLSRTGQALVDLRWDGAAGELVDLYRDGVLVDSIDNNGRYRDRFVATADSVSYSLCQAGTDNCSAPLTVDF
ncbi:S8 family serine peptidase [Gallaecimonas xiamenensis]|uniref:Peptidase S8/S53 subtilisin kexin sedolisin n=1 Tax=Gallaecimonas xiamenensis 3-C-1 TaxID=745411 RepID=K2JP07_9GAMM|nr:S8 family serine peptidase [Gallaecimonas xiamenensis]EKE77018.1 peptidase S8/S53 subtilisin kexin sedolisin [Gallaecimonas xiamenensis 3-C-1]